MRYKAEQGDNIQQKAQRRRFPWGTLLAPVCIVALLGAALVTSPRAPWRDSADPQLVAAPGQQLHYLPFDALQFLTTLRGQHGSSTSIENPVRLIASIVSARENNTVIIDHWEDGFDVDPVNSPGATTETNVMGEGEVQVLNNLVDTAKIGQINPNGNGQPYYDGRDKIVSLEPTVVTAGGWPSNATTLHAGASAVPEVSRYGYQFVSPVGENTPFFSAAGSPWEYTGLIVTAAEDNTTVTVTGFAPFSLDEGEAHLVDGGVDVGDSINASKPVAVYLSTGDKLPAQGYEGRLYELTPTERWSDTYFSPVTSRNDTRFVTRAFFYNPGSSAITISYTQSNGTTGTFSVPAGGQNNFKFPMNVGASFRSAGNPFYALQAITTPESGSGNDVSSSYNWGFSLIPSQYLTPMIVAGYAPGSENTPTLQNDNVIWVAPEATTTIYIDRDGDTSTGVNMDPNGNRYDFTCTVDALTPRLVKDDGSSTCYTASAITNAVGTGDADMTGARIYTLDGTRLAAAWGQVPELNATQPAIDMGTTILPFPTVDLQKDSAIVDDDGDGLADPGETIRYTITATNTGISPVDNLVVTDDIPLYTSYVTGSTIHNGSPIADNGSGTPFPLDGAGTILPPALSVGQTRTVTFDVLVDDPLDPLATQIVNEATLQTSYGTYVAIDVQPTSPPEPSITLAKTVYAGHDGGASCQGGDDVTGVNGDEITYCFTAENDGSTFLGTVTVDDPTLGIDDTDMDLIAGDPSLVAAGDSVTWAYETTLDGDVTNVATATGAPVDGSNVPLPDMDPVTDADSAAVDQVAPALTVAKTVYRGHDDGAFCEGGDSEVGVQDDPVTYCFEVTNTGDTHLAPVTLDDPALGIDEGDMTVASGSLALLAPGDSIELYYEATFDGDLLNVVTAEGTPSDPGGTPLPGIDAVVVADDASLIQVAPEVSVEKTVYRGHTAGAGCAGTENVAGLNGDAVTFCFVVTNEGDVDLTPVTLTDAALGIDDTDLTPTFGSLADLAPGEFAVLYYETTMNGDLTNTAVVTGAPHSGGVPVPTPEPITDSDTASVDAVGPAVSVAKTVYLGHDDGVGCEGSETVFADSGDDVTYCFSVTNNGDVDLAPVVVTDGDLGIDASDMTLLEGDLDSLAPGDTALLYFEDTVNGDLTNLVDVTGTPVDEDGDPLPVPDPEDDDTAEVDEVHPEVSIAKTVYRAHNSGAGCPGGELVRFTTDADLTYCFEVTNEGDTALAPLTIADPALGITQADMTVLSGSLASLAPGDSAVLYFETDLDGDVLNTATVTGTPVDDGGIPMAGIDQVTASDTAEVDEVGPAISVAKTVYAGDDDGAGCPGNELQRGANGAELTYCFVVTNEGDTTLAPVTLADGDLGIDQTEMEVASGSLSSLAPGDSVALYFETTLNGDLINTVTARGTAVDSGGDPVDGVDPVEASDTAEVDELTPSITIAKTVYRGDTNGAGCPGLENVPGRNGDVVTYCFAVTNNGGATLARVAVDDDDLNISHDDMAVLSGSLTSLAPGATVVLYYETTISRDLENTAVATGDPVDGTDPLPGATQVTDDDTASVDELTPSIDVDKTVYTGHDLGVTCPGGELVQTEAGADVTYCFSVTNTGDTTLAPVTLDDLELGIDDTDMTVLSGDLSQLDPSETAVLYYETTVDDDLVNEVTATGVLADPSGDPLDGLAPVTATDTAEVDQVAPSVSVAKSVYRGHDGGATCPGGERIVGATGAAITYCFVVSNDGDTTLDDLEIVDGQLAIDETEMTVVGGGSLSPLAPGATVTLYFETLLDGDITNIAEVTGTPVDDGGDPIPGIDPVTDDDTAQAEDVSPSISLEKSVYYGHTDGAGCPAGGAVAVRTGAAITYCFVITNDGETTLAPVTIDDAFLGGIDGIDAADMTLASGDLDSMEPGDTATLYYETTADDDLVNTAVASGEPVDDGGDPLPGGQTVTDEGTASVDVVDPSISIAKSVYRGHDDGDTCDDSLESVTGLGGDAITYCFAVRNDGDTPLAPVTIGDLDLGANGIDDTDMDVVGTGDLDSLAPGATVTLYFETTIDGDLLPNTATATGTPVDGNGDPLDHVDDVTDDDTASVDEVDPAVSVEKTVYRGHDGGATCPGGELATLREGALITYCFVVRNDGDTSLTDLRLEDRTLGIDQSEMAVYGPGTLDLLAPGATLVLYFQTTVTDDVTNVVTVTGTPSDPGGDPLPDLEDVTDDDTAVVDEVAPSISVAKTVARGHSDGANCNGTDVLSGLAGEAITYCFAIFNSGDTPLAPVTFADPALGVTTSGLSFVDGDLDSLAPGQTVVAYVETNIDGNLLNSALVTGTPVDDQDVPLPGVPDVSDDDDAQVYEVDPSVSIAKTVYRGHDDGEQCDAGSNLVAGRNGDHITYCFTVTNDGDTPLAPVTVADVPLGISQDQMTPLDDASLDQLDPQETVVLYFETTVNGNLTNVAVATGNPADDDGDPLPGVDDVTDDDDAAVRAVGPAISVAKTVYAGANGGAGCATAGELVSAVAATDVTYCFAVTNNGDTDLAPVTLVDDDLDLVPGDLTVVGGLGSLDSIPAGETVVLYVETTLDADLVNTAEVTGTPVDEQGDELGISDVTDDDTAEVDEVAPAVSIEKTVYRGHDDGAGCPGSEVVSGVGGRPVTYCVTVENDGDTTLAPVTVDDLALGIDEALLSGPTGDLASLAPGESVTLWYETTLEGDLTNTATVTGTPVDGTSTPLPDVDPVSDDDTARVDQIAPSMTLLTEVLDPFTGDHFDADGEAGTPGSNDPTPATLRAGDTASYRFTVTNTGDAAISDVVVDAAQCDAAPVLVSGDTLNPGVLDEGETWVFTCDVSDVTAGFTMDASVTGASTDGAPDGSGDHETAAAQVASISVEKRVLDEETDEFGEITTIETGGDAIFEIVVTNTGEVPLAGATVSDDLAPGCARSFLDTLEPGDSFAAYTCLVRDIDEGYVNTATVTATPVDDGDDPIGNDVSDDDAATVVVEDDPVTDLALTKDLVGIDTDTAVATWLVTVTNVGDTSATQPIIVTDDLPPELSYRNASGDGWACEYLAPTVTCVTDTDLVPGGSTSFTVETYVNAAPGTTVVNTARVDGIDDTDTDNNTDQALVDIDDQGDITPQIPQNLPRTGADVVGLVAAAGLLILTGLVFRRASRRRLA